MATIFDTLKNVEDPIVGAKVTVSLVVDVNGTGEGFVTADQFGIGFHYTTYTDDEGRWEVIGTPNEEISPANTVYKVVVKYPGSSRKDTNYFTIPAEDGDYWLYDVLTEAPGDLPDPNLLDEHIANASDPHAAAGYAKQADLSAHLNDTTDAHDASAISFSPTGSVAGTDLQAAVAEVASEAASAVSSEASTRASADTTLQTNITNEATARANADTAHAADTTNIHGITDTSLLETTTGSAAKVAAHEADTTAVHGIANTANLETSAGAQAKVDAAIAALVNSAPGLLDTLDEIAAALGDDPNFATTITNLINARITKATLDANTLLKADTDDTPVALTVAEQTLVGRITGGNVDDLSVAQVKTLLALAGADIANTPAGTVAASTVQGAINELDSEKETPAGAQAKVDTHVNDTTAAHAASAIGVTPSGNLAADDVQEALTELQTGLNDFAVNVRDYGATGAGGTYHTHIQAAIDVVNTAGGGTVLLPPGDFGIGAALELGSNTQLRGSGYKTRLFRTSTFGDALLTNKGRGSTVYAGNSNLIVRDLYLDDRRDDLGASSSPQACLAFGHCDGILVENVWTDQCYYHGIEINSSRHFVVRSCFVTNARSSGIQLDKAESGGFTGLNADGTIVRDGVVTANNVWDCAGYSDSVMDRAGAIHVHKHPAKNIAITNNIIKNCANGITVENANDGTVTEVHEGITITGNTLEQIVKDPTDTRTLNGYGIYCTPCSGLVISGNTMRNVERRAIRLISAASLRHSSVSITGNHIHLNSGDYAIDVAKTDGFSISGNVIAGSWRAATLAAIICGEDTTGGTVGNNLLQGQGSGTIYGIAISSPSSLSCSDVTVVGNTISDFTNGIRVAQQGGGTFTDINVGPNLCADCTTGVVFTGTVTDSVLNGIRTPGCTTGVSWGASVDNCVADNILVRGCTTGFTYTMNSNLIGKVKDDTTVRAPVIPTDTNKVSTARRATGNLTLNSTSWANLPSLGTLTLAVQTGDIIQVGLSGRFSSENVWGFLDVATIVSAAVVNSLSGVAESANNEGITGWSGVAGSIHSNIGSPVLYTIQSGDISSGTVTLQIRYRTLTAANKTLLADSNRPLTFWARVL